MQVAVIGGGVIGVSTAYCLAAAGHEVVLLERGNNVAEEGSFGNSGLVAPASAAPWAAPGMPRQLLSLMFKSASPLLLRRRFDPALWRWTRRWLTECELERFQINKNRLLRLGIYSRELLEQLRLHYHLDYEQTGGHLRLFRTERDVLQARHDIALLQQSEITHQLLDPAAARAIEPALSASTALSAALYLPQDEAGNCALFTKQLKTIAQQLGVTFQFGCTVTHVETHDQRVELRSNLSNFSADAVVLACGGGNAALLGTSGVRLPLQAVQGYSATCSIRDFDEAPLASLTDATYKTTITRFGNRIRIAGVAEPGARSLEVPPAAQHTLHKIGNDWFPNATNYNNSSLWSGMRPMLPDGVPLLGPTSPGAKR